MKNWSKFTVLAAAVSLLPACMVSESSYEHERLTLANDAVLKRQYVDGCTDYVSNKRRADREMLAALMKVPATRVNITFCRRMINAWASGRLSYSDYKTIMEGGKGDMRRVVAILQGR